MMTQAACSTLAKIVFISMQVVPHDHSIIELPSHTAGAACLLLGLHSYVCNVQPNDHVLFLSQLYNVYWVIGLEGIGKGSEVSVIAWG